MEAVRKYEKGVSSNFIILDQIRSIRYHLVMVVAVVDGIYSCALKDKRFTADIKETSSFSSN